MLAATAPPPRASIGSWVGTGSNLIRAEPGRWALLTLIVLVPLVLPMVGATVLLSLALNSVIPVMQDPTAVTPGVEPAYTGLLAMSLPFLTMALFLAMAISGWLSIGLWKAALHQLGGQRPSARAFQGTLGLLPPVLFTSLVVSVVVFVGLLLFVLPGVVAIAAFQFAIPLTIERGLGPIDAMAESWRVTRGDLAGYVLHALVVSVLSSLGGYLCGVGLLLTYPLYFTATAAAFRDLYPTDPNAH